MLPVRLNERQSVFVVLRKTAAEESKTIEKPETVQLAEIKGPWQITFPTGLGAPESTVMTELISWTESKNKCIKYFSGTATYRNALNVPGKWLREGNRLILDPGRVGDLAEVIVNDIPVDMVWCYPMRCDITRF